MNNTVFFLNMFSDYEPQEDLGLFLRDALMLAADIDPVERRITVRLGSERYIPQPSPPAMPMSASRASPGPLTTQPITATVMGFWQSFRAAST